MEKGEKETFVWPKLHCYYKGNTVYVLSRKPYQLLQSSENILVHCIIYLCVKVFQAFGLHVFTIHLAKEELSACITYVHASNNTVLPMSSET